jgi:S1-C subfamily serine protease
VKPDVRTAALVVVAALAGGGAAVGIGAAATGSSVTTIREPAPVAAQSVSVTSGGISPAAIYRQDAPGVVVVTATTTTKQANPFDPFAPPQKRSVVAIGSGFVTDAGGHVLTNAHVVLGATDVRVGLAGGATYGAKVLGLDRSTDVAVLQVQGAPAAVLHPLPLGTVRTVRVGDPVVAIGNPLDKVRTITAGIVSAKLRQIQSLRPGVQIYNALQTDAAINHGNSGGPLIDRYGRVIGITSQILTGSGNPNAGNIGIGFAIPIDTARSIASQIVAHGAAQHTYLGIEGTALDPSIAQALNLPADHGVLVERLVPGSPADKAGLRGGTTPATIGGNSIVLGGDIITAIDGHPITAFSQLARAISSHSAGQSVTLDVLRAGKSITIRVTLATRSG